MDAQETPEPCQKPDKDVLTLDMLSDILVMYDDVFGEERVFLENNYLLFVQIR